MGRRGGGVSSFVGCEWEINLSGKSFLSLLGARDSSAIAWLVPLVIVIQVENYSHVV